MKPIPNLMRYVEIKFILFSFIFLLSASIFAADKAVAIVDKVRGGVLILGPNARVLASVQGGEGRRQIVKGMEIFEGETVQTKDDGRIRIKFFEADNELTVGGGSSVVVEKAPGKNDNAKQKKTVLALKRGSVRSEVKSHYDKASGSSYEVQTSNAVAGVRGTIFGVMFDSKKGTTAVATQRGLVAVQNPKTGASVMVKPGQFSRVSANLAPSKPKPVSESPEMMKSMSEANAEEDTGADPSSEQGGSEDSAKKEDSTSADSGGEDSSVAKSDSGSGDDKAAPEGGGEDSPPLALAPDPKADEPTSTASGGADGGADRSPASTSNSPPPAPVIMGINTQMEGFAGVDVPFTRATGSIDQIRDAVQSSNQQQQQGTVSGPSRVVIPIK